MCTWVTSRSTVNRKDVLHHYLSQVRKYGGVETRLIAYIEYLIISVMVQANSSRGKPRESCEGGSMYRISQVTYTLQIVGRHEQSVDHR